MGECPDKACSASTRAVRIVAKPTYAAYALVLGIRDPYSIQTLSSLVIVPFFMRQKSRWFILADSATVQNSLKLFGQNVRQVVLRAESTRLRQGMMELLTCIMTELMGSHQS